MVHGIREVLSVSRDLNLNRGPCRCRYRDKDLGMGAGHGIPAGDKSTVGGAAL